MDALFNQIGGQVDDVAACMPLFSPDPSVPICSDLLFYLDLFLLARATFCQQSDALELLLIRAQTLIFQICIVISNFEHEVTASCRIVVVAAGFNFRSCAVGAFSPASQRGTESYRN